MLKRISPILLLVLLFSCSNPVPKPKIVTKRDTVLAHLDFPQGYKGEDSVVIVTRPARKFANDSILTAYWGVDSSFFLGQRVDTVKDRTGKVVVVHFAYFQVVPDSLSQHVHLYH
jgi:hypothetical protein